MSSNESNEKQKKLDDYIKEYESAKNEEKKLSIEMKINISRLKTMISRRLDTSKVTQKIKQINAKLSTLQKKQDMLLDLITELEAEINRLFEKRKYRKKMLNRF